MPPPAPLALRALAGRQPSIEVRPLAAEPQHNPKGDIMEKAPITDFGPTINNQIAIVEGLIEKHGKSRKATRDLWRQKIGLIHFRDRLSRRRTLESRHIV